MDTPNQEKKEVICVNHCSICHQRSAGHQPESSTKDFICFICHVESVLDTCKTGLNTIAA